MRLFLNASLVLTLTLTVTACGQGMEVPASVARVTKVSDQERVARAFVVAFSKHDIEAMAALCADNLQWGYVEGTQFSRAGNSVDMLRAQMKDYFSETPDVRSEVEDLIAHKDTIAMTERVFWTPAEGGDEQSQASIAVYQFEAGKIAAVWYYPAQ